MQPTSQIQQPKVNKRKVVWGLICLIGPTALLVVSFIGYALLNFLAGSAQPAEGELFTEEPAWKSIANIVLFLTGAITVLTWLPGIIVGIILLATSRK